jgi:uncharacterized protein HemX
MDEQPVATNGTTTGTPVPPKTSRTSTIVITAIVAALISGLLTYAYMMNTHNTASQSANAEIASLKSQNSTLTTQNETLTKQNKALAAEAAKGTPTPVVHTVAPTAVPTVKAVTTPVKTP